MAYPFGRDACYNMEKDGNLKKYLETHDEMRAMPLFRGHKYYRMLWDEGYFEPSESRIRVYMKDETLEHYLVKSGTEIEGIEHIFWAGKPGIHHPEDILTDEGPPWEAVNLRPWLELFSKKSEEK